MSEVYLDQIRIILSLVMLGIATMSDIKKREISDFIWIIFGGIGFGLIFLGTDFNQELFRVGISLIVAPFAILIWRIGLFGGADAFAIIVLAIIAPGLTVSHSTIMPFTVLTNTVLISIVPMIINVTRNSILLATKHDIFEGFNESVKKKTIAMIVGYRAANPKFGFSIEQKIGNQKKLNLALQHADTTAYCEKTDTWITPGIPYMTFILAGFAIQLIYGDILVRMFFAFR